MGIDPKENKDIEKALCPKAYELQTDEDDNCFVHITDMELDSFKAVFNYDGCIQIDTSGYNHITLSEEQLYKLAALIQDAEDHYSNQ